MAERYDSVGDYLDRFSRMENDRSAFDNTWQDIADHEIGRRNFTTVRTPGRERMSQIYDTTAITSLDLLSSALHSLLTNSAVRWFEIETEFPGMNEQKDIRMWLENAKDIMYAAFNRNEAAFTSNMHEVYFDLAAFGTCCLYIGDQPGFGPYFSSRPLGEIYFAEDSRGRIDTVFRKFVLSARQAVQKFGEEEVPFAVKKLESNESDDTFNFLHVVTPNPDVQYGYIDYGGMPFHSCYVCIDEEMKVSEGGYWEMPYCIARWEKDSGETYGRGPGWRALADAKMLNAMNKTMLEAAQKSVNPPLLVADDGEIPQLNAHPNGVITYRAGTLSDDPIRYLEARSQFQIGVAEIQDKRENVRRAFHWELLQLYESPHMTATQVIELANQTQRLLAPVIGRMQSELLEPIIERVFGVLLRAGAFAQPPEILQGQNLTVNYLSPASRAQRMSDSSAIVEAVGTAIQLSEAFPTMIDLFNPDEIARQVAESKGAPASILRSPEEIAAIRQQRAMAQQEAAKEQAMKDAVETMTPVMGAMGAG